MNAIVHEALPEDYGVILTDPEEGDVGQREQHSLSDQVEADRYLALREARSKPHKALRFTKHSPPAA